MVQRKELPERDKKQHKQEVNPYFNDIWLYISPLIVFIVGLLVIASINY